MDNEINFGEKIFEHIRALAVDIGPRPAGTDSEEMGREYIINLLQTWGIQPEEQSVYFAPLPKFYTINFLMGAILITFSWLIRESPTLTIWLPLIYIVFPNIVRWEVGRRRKTKQTKNVIGYLDCESESQLPLLILCAHVDTARAIGLENRLLRWLYSYSMYIVQRVAYLVSILSLFNILLFNVSNSLFFLVGILGTVVGVWFIGTDLFNQVAHKNRYTHGANDNASGVGVVLALAEYYSKHPPKRLRVGFLFTGAEETGMHGAKTFAQRLVETQGKKAVVNLDMVGSGGTPCFVEKEGSLFAIRTDRQLNRLLMDINPEMKSIQYLFRSGDFSAFIKLGIPATSIETRGSQDAMMANHSTFDDIRLISNGSLVGVTRTLIKFIDRLPYSDWAFSKSKN